MKFDKEHIIHVLNQLLDDVIAGKYEHVGHYDPGPGDWDSGRVSIHASKRILILRGGFGVRLRYDATGSCPSGLTGGVLRVAAFRDTQIWAVTGSSTSCNHRLYGPWESSQDYSDFLYKWENKDIKYTPMRAPRNNPPVRCHPYDGTLIDTNNAKISCPYGNGCRLVSFDTIEARYALQSDLTPDLSHGIAVGPGWRLGESAVWHDVTKPQKVRVVGGTRRRRNARRRVNR